MLSQNNCAPRFLSSLRDPGHTARTERSVATAIMQRLPLRITLQSGPIFPDGTIMNATLETRKRTGMRRGQPRRRLSLTTTAVQAGESASVNILNLSSSGLLLRTDESLALDEPLLVEMPNSGEKAARVVWSDGTLYGCRFDSPLSTADVSAARLKADVGDGPEEGLAATPAPLPSTATVRSGSTIGARIKQLRIASGRSMTGLAKVVGVTKPTLWKWETDRVHPRPAMLEKLASVLGVAPETLLVGSAAALGAAHGAVEDGTLYDVIQASRQRIAGKAGVEEERVSIEIDWS